jgi:hypothetical protein
MKLRSDSKKRGSADFDYETDGFVDNGTACGRTPGALVTMKLGSDSKTTSRVAGNTLFFYGKDLCGQWNAVLSTERLKPPTTGLMAIGNNNTPFHLMQHQCSGHLAMLLQDGVWKLVVIKKFAPSSFKFQLMYFNRDGRIHPGIHELKTREEWKNKLMFWVNLFPPAGPALKEFNQNLTDPAYLFHDNVNAAQFPSSLQGFGHLLSMIKIQVPCSSLQGVGRSLPTVQIPKKKKNRKSKRGIMFRSPVLDEPWHTIFVSPSSKQPLSMMTKDVFLFPSPLPLTDGSMTAVHLNTDIHNSFILEPRLYYAVPKSRYQQNGLGHNGGLGLSIIDYLALLRDLKKTLFFDIKAKGPTRFVIVSQEDFQRLKTSAHDNDIDGGKLFSCSEQEYIYKHTALSNFLLPGATVSMWRHMPEMKSEFGLEMACDVQNCVGKGFGNRPSTCSEGVNVYFGQHHCHYLSSSPGQSDAAVKPQLEYHRQGYSDDTPIKAAVIQGVFGAGLEVLDFASHANHNYMALIGKNNCSKAIWTQGISERVRKCLDHKSMNSVSFKKSRISRRGCISFGNAPHRDKCDKWVKKDQVNTHLNHLDSKCPGHFKAKLEQCKTKMKCINEFVGLGVPTTCWYNHLLGSRAGDCDLISRFCQFHFAIPTDHKWTHHMMAWTFWHCTAMSILVSENGMVRTNNEGYEDDPTLVLAWGVGNNSRGSLRTN